MNRLSQEIDPAEILMPGMLLLAHPAMRDPHFGRAVILLSAYDPDQGAMGVVFNHPLQKPLASLMQPMTDPTLAQVPLYNGGPVQPEQLVLTAWRWDFDLPARFQLHFGITAERAQALASGPNPFHLRAFLGHAGWAEGQLEAEIEEGAWVCLPVHPELDQADGEHLWKSLVCATDPRYRILCEEPEDPSLN